MTTLFDELYKLKLVNFKIYKTINRDIKNIIDYDKFLKEGENQSKF
jgi:hypothetical protein